MTIKKKPKNYEVKYYLTIMNLSRKSRDVLLELLAKFRPEVRSMHGKEGRYVVFIDLRKSHDHSIMTRILLRVRRKLEIEITASLVSNCDQGGFDVPEWIMRLCTKIEAGFGFTFTCV